VPLAAIVRVNAATMSGKGMDWNYRGHKGNALEERRHGRFETSSCVANEY
jgi:hypothetical protein